jgi:hypothetical protein
MRCVADMVGVLAARCSSGSARGQHMPARRRAANDRADQSPVKSICTLWRCPQTR